MSKTKNPRKRRRRGKKEDVKVDERNEEWEKNKKR